MQGSINFIFHLFGFGLLITTLIGGFMLEFQYRKEREIKQKLFVLSLAKKFGLLSPFVSLFMLATGMGNMYNMYGSSFHFAVMPAWLTAKIIFFAMLLVNGAVLGPILSRKRTAFLKTIEENIFSEKIGSTLKSFNKNISFFYAVQILLVIIILVLSVIGTGKHPGAF